MRTTMQPLFHGLIHCLALVGLVSCGTLPVPAASTQTALPPSRIITFTTTSNREASQTPVYTITTEFPVLMGSGEPHAAQFNQLVSDLVQKQVDEFKQGMQGMSNPPIAMGSFFDLHPGLVSVAGNLLSLKLIVDAYADGAAHPYQISVTFNYDLAAGQALTLDRLFLPGSSYLEKIADFCKAQLAARDIAFDASSGGADPTPENYRNWNITSDGLLVTFDEYQVAAYAAGPQIVVIPFKELQGIIDPQGPLAAFKP